MFRLKVLLVIAHPAHVHFFKNFVEEMEKRGHKVALMVKERENTTELLDIFELDYQVFGKTYTGRFLKGIGIFLNDSSLLKKAKSFRPDVTASIGGLYSVHVGKILGVPTIDFMDTEGARFTNLLTFPFADIVATPDCYRSSVPEKNHIQYPSYHELAYLHPDRFTPSKDILEELGLQKKEYSLVRFSSFDASHQRGENVLNLKKKIELIEELARYGKVLIDSEGALPSELKEFRLDIPPDRFHDLLAYAKLYVGEGATTAAEAGVLGVPWVYISREGRCYLQDQQDNYRLGRQVGTYQEAVDYINEVMKGSIEDLFRKRKKRLLEDKIDPTPWMVELFEGLY